MLKSLLSEIDTQIVIMDFTFDEIKEHQLGVDLAIEEYFYKVEQYPRPLKVLFDMGSKLLVYFKAFNEKNYNFQMNLNMLFN